MTSKKTSMVRQLVPELKLRNRFIALGIMVIPVLFAYRIGVVWQLASCIVPVILTGTYREAHLEGDWFHTQFYMGFIPISRDRCKLPAVVNIVTTYGSNRAGWGTFFLLGPAWVLFSWLCDYLIPALGGTYEIWLETAKGKEILAWTGNGEEHFQQNLEYLRTRTGADVRTR
jgi:hypothetical protein